MKKNILSTISRFFDFGFNYWYSFGVFLLAFITFFNHHYDFLPFELKTHSLAITAALFSCLVPIAIFNFNDVRAITKVKVRNENIKHLLVELADILINHNVEVVKFSSNVFSKEKFLNEGYSGLSCPLFKFASLVKILRDCNWSDIEDEKLRELLADILTMTDGLLEAADRISKAYWVLKTNHRSPLIQLIEKVVSKAPEQDGPIHLKEFDLANDLCELIVTFRMECHSTIVKIKTAIDRMKIKDERERSKYHTDLKRLDQILLKVGEIDGAAKIRIHYLTLASHVNELRDGFRVKIMEKKLLEIQAEQSKSKKPEIVPAEKPAV